MDTKFSVSHVVDQGDVACVLNTVNPAFFLCQGQVGAADKQRLHVQAVFANIATSNYLLAGMQRPELQHGWNKVREAFGWFDGEAGGANRNGRPHSMDRQSSPVENFGRVERIVRTGIIPFGICAGSEKQGGQTETGFAPVQAAANHVTTMTVDGQNIDLVNYWSDEPLNAGDQLVLKLQWKTSKNYVLNHYYKHVSHGNFESRRDCWQLVPSVFCMGEKTDDNPVLAQFDYRLQGYWRIAQMMHHRNACASHLEFWANDNANMRGGGSAQPLQVLFAPTYHNMHIPPTVRSELMILEDSESAAATTVVAVDVAKRYADIAGGLLQFVQRLYRHAQTKHSTAMSERVKEAIEANKLEMQVLQSSITEILQLLTDARKNRDDCELAAQTNPNNAQLDTQIADVSDSIRTMEIEYNRKRVEMDTIDANRTRIVSMIEIASEIGCASKPFTLLQNRIHDAEKRVRDTEQSYQKLLKLQSETDQHVVENCQTYQSFLMSQAPEGGGVFPFHTLPPIHFKALYSLNVDNLTRIRSTINSNAIPDSLEDTHGGELSMYDWYCKQAETIDLGNFDELWALHYVFTDIVSRPDVNIDTKLEQSSKYLIENVETRLQTPMYEMPVREALKLIDEVLNCYAVIFFAQMTLTAIELKSCTVDSCKDDDAVNVRLLKTVLSKHVTQTVFPVRDLLHSNFKNALDILNLHNKTFTHNGKAYIVDHHHTTATQTPIDSRDTTNSHADDQHSHSDMDRMLPTRLGAPAPSTHATFSANFNAVAAAPAAAAVAAPATVVAPAAAVAAPAAAVAAPAAAAGGPAPAKKSRVTAVRTPAPSAK